MPWMTAAPLRGIVVDEALDLESSESPRPYDLAGREHAGPAGADQKRGCFSADPAWAARVLLCERSYT